MDTPVRDSAERQELEALKETFVTTCRILAMEGLADAAFNISCRFGQNQLMINPVTSPTLVTKENIRIHALDERPDMGQLHPSIYKARPDVNAIVHVHPPYAIAFSTLGIPYIPIHHYGSLFHGDRLAVHKSPGQVKTKERGDDIARALGPRRVILQQGHGATTVGKDLKEALLVAIYLEEAMKILFIANQMGTPKTLSEEQSELIIGQIFKQRSQDKAWYHYVDKLRLWWR